MWLKVKYETVWSFQSAVSHSVTRGAEKIIFGEGTRLIVDSGERKRHVLYDWSQTARFNKSEY